MEAHSVYSLQHPDEMKTIAAADLLRSGGRQLPPSATSPRPWHLWKKVPLCCWEKNIFPNRDERLTLREKARQSGRGVAACHVLRYPAFYSQPHQLPTDGLVGRVETIDAAEHVAYWHQAHSLVRGS